MKKRTTYSTHIKVLLTILVTALLLIEVSASEHHVIAQGELTDQELADTLVMETVAALDWDQTPGEDSAFSSVFELDHYLTNANATYFVAGGNVFYYYALVLVFPTDEDAEAYLHLVLNHEAMDKQVNWYGPDEDWTAWWWSRASQTATFHGINAVQAHHPGYEPSQGPHFLGWPMKNFFIGCFETPSTNSGGYKLGCTEFLYQRALNYGLGIELSPNPEPPDLNPNPEPNPNPDPGPIEIDSETLRILQSILSTPVVPITGAVAGGLMAWILSLLGGGRTVLPPVPRPPTGGLRPGQVEPDGKILSPTGQGWVSKSIYDYQQKWLQKGWRWNSQTGQFEGQHGAVNENGLVQDDELGWVDQKTFQDNEQMRSEGMVYDHGLSGWIKPNDLADFNRSKQDFRDKVSSPEARQRDHERLMQQEVAPDPQYQKIDNVIKQIDDKLNKWQSDSIKGDMEFEQRKSQRQLERMETMDRWSKRAGVAEAGADVFISVAATLTGPVGKSIESGYTTIKRTALALDTGITKKSIKAAVLDYGESYIKDKVVDKVSSALSVDTVSSVPGKVFKKFVAGTGKPGIKAFSKPLLKGVKGVGAVVDYGKSHLVEEGVDELGEYFDQIVQAAPGG